MPRSQGDDSSDVNSVGVLFGTGIGSAVVLTLATSNSDNVQPPNISKNTNRNITRPKRDFFGWSAFSDVGEAYGLFGRTPQPLLGRSVVSEQKPVMPAVPVMVGEPFRSDKHRNRSAVFRCSCQQHFLAIVASVRKGDTKSCGCLRALLASATRDTNGTQAPTVDGVTYAKHPLYWTWRGIQQRTGNPKHKGWKHYGGRPGNPIKVCDRWLIGEGGKNGFTCFVKDMGSRPDGTSLDRIDNDGNYEPSNCTFSTPTQQARNTRYVKLNCAKVSRIKRRIQRQDRIIDIASDYGVATTTIASIKNEKSWSDVQPDPEVSECA